VADTAGANPFPNEGRGRGGSLLELDDAVDGRVDALAGRHRLGERIAVPGAERSLDGRGMRAVVGEGGRRECCYGEQRGQGEKVALHPSTVGRGGARVDTRSSVVRRGGVGGATYPSGR